MHALMAEGDRPGRLDWDLIAAWTAAVFSSIAAIAGFWSAYEAHRQANIAIEAEARASQTALVESCQASSPALFHVGDDFDAITGRLADDEYWSAAEPRDFDQQRPRLSHRYLRCVFTNLSPVPLLSVTIYYQVEFHHHKTVKVLYNSPFALAAGATQALWFFDNDREPIVMHVPSRARYFRFPDLHSTHVQPFLPALRDSWIVYRDSEPDEQLDQSAIK